MCQKCTLPLTPLSIPCCKRKDSFAINCIFQQPLTERNKPLHLPQPRTSNFTRDLCIKRIANETRGPQLSKIPCRYTFMRKRYSTIEWKMWKRLRGKMRRFPTFVPWTSRENPSSSKIPCRGGALSERKSPPPGPPRVLKASSRPAGVWSTTLRSVASPHQRTLNYTI